MQDVADLARFLVQDFTWAELFLFWVMVLLGLVSLSAVLLPRLARVLYPPLERTTLADLLDLDSIVGEGKIIRSNNGALTIVIELSGQDPGALTAPERDEARDRRKQFLYAISPKIHLRLISSKRREGNLLRRRRVAELNTLRSRIVEQWEKQFQRNFATRHILTLTVPGGTSHGLELLDEALKEAKRLLRIYDPRLLSVGDVGDHSPLLELYAGLFNTAAVPVTVAARYDRIGSAIASGSIEWDLNSGQIVSSFGERRKYSWIIGIEQWEQWTHDDLVRALMSLEGEITLVHHGQVFSDLQIAGQLKAKERQARDQAEDESLNSPDKQVKMVTLMVQPDAPEQEKLIGYAIQIHVHGESEAEALALRDQVIDHLTDRKLTPLVEDEIAAILFWTQFPGHEQYAFTRRNVFLLRNVADLLGVPTPTEGLRTCDFAHMTGQPDGWLFRAKTAYGSTYHVNLHASAKPGAVGHTLLFGGTGAGKSHLLSLMTMGGVEHFPGLMVVAFDKDLGFYVTTKAAGGSYRGLIDAVGHEKGVQLMPWGRPMSGRMKVHLTGLLRMLIGLEGQETEAAIEFALRIISRMDEMKSPLSRRSLENIVETAFVPGSAARQAIDKWIHGGAYAMLFGGKQEFLGDVGEAAVTTYDLTSVVKDPELMAPIIYDLGFVTRMTARAKKRPFMMIVDEASAAFANPQFRKAAVDWMDTIRKEHGVVVTSWQRPSQIAAAVGNDTEGKALQATFQQAATFIFLRDRQADYEQYSGFVSEQQFAIIKGTDDRWNGLQHIALLIKPGSGESVLLNMDMTGLGELMKFFSSDADAASKAIELQQSHGINWPQAFMAHHAAQKR